MFYVESSNQETDKRIENNGGSEGGKYQSWKTVQEVLTCKEVACGAG